MRTVFQRLKSPECNLAHGLMMKCAPATPLVEDLRYLVLGEPLLETFPLFNGVNRVDLLIQSHASLYHKMNKMYHRFSLWILYCIFHLYTIVVIQTDHFCYWVVIFISLHWHATLPVLSNGMSHDAHIRELYGNKEAWFTWWNSWLWFEAGRGTYSCVTGKSVTTAVAVARWC